MKRLIIIIEKINSWKGWKIIMILSSMSVKRLENIHIIKQFKAEIFGITFS